MIDPLCSHLRQSTQSARGASTNQKRVVFSNDMALQRWMRRVTESVNESGAPLTVSSSGSKHFSVYKSYVAFTAHRIPAVVNVVMDHFGHEMQSVESAENGSVPYGLIRDMVREIMDTVDALHAGANLTHDQVRVCCLCSASQ